MQRQDQIIPLDVMGIIFDFMPDLQTLVNMRQVSKTMRTKVDQVILKPINILQILPELDSWQMRKFLNYVKSSSAYHMLNARAANDAEHRNTKNYYLEKVCLALVEATAFDLDNYYGKDSYNDFVRRRLQNFFQAPISWSADDLFSAVVQLPPLTARALIESHHHLASRYLGGILIQLINNEWELIAQTYIREVENRDPASPPLDREIIKRMLLLIVCDALWLKLDRINARILTIAINRLLSEFGYGSNTAFVKCVLGLKVTLAALQRTPEAWEIVRNGAPSYINLVGADLTLAQLDGAQLAGANLCGCICRHTILTNANLKGAILMRAKLVDSNLTGADLSYCHTNFYTEFDNTILHKVNFKGMYMPHGRSALMYFTDSNINGTRWIPAFEFHNHFPPQERYSMLVQQLNTLARNIKDKPTEHLIRTAIAYHVLRLLPKTRPQVAVEMLNHVLKHSILFTHRNIGNRVVSATAGIFANNAHPTAAGRLLREELRRLEKQIAETKLKETAAASSKKAGK